MVRDVILYIDFWLLILLFCWFCEMMPGAVTAEWRLTLPLQTLKVLSFLEISWYKKKMPLDPGPLLPSNSLGQGEGKLFKSKGWSFYSVQHFSFLLGDLKMELESSGKWGPLDVELRANPWNHSVFLFLFAAKHSDSKRNLNVYPENLIAVV